MTRQSQNQPASAREGRNPAMPPEKVSQVEEEAAAELPQADRASVERSAGEGLVGTSVEASTMATNHIQAAGELVSSSGARVAAVTVDLQITPPAWSGTLTPGGGETLALASQYRLRLEDGREGIVTVQERAGEVYVVEGTGPLEPANRRRPDR